jgi:hypothetical protein
MVRNSQVTSNQHARSRNVRIYPIPTYSNIKPKVDTGLRMRKTDGEDKQRSPSIAMEWMRDDGNLAVVDSTDEERCTRKEWNAKEEEGPCSMWRNLINAGIRSKSAKSCPCEFGTTSECALQAGISGLQEQTALKRPSYFALSHAQLQKS